MDQPQTEPGQLVPLTPLLAYESGRNMVPENTPETASKTGTILPGMGGQAFVL